MADTLFDCYLVAKDFLAFELERCAGMNTCVAPLSANAWIPFTLSHSAALSKRPRRKEERSRERKVSESRLPGCHSGSGVKGRHRGGMSGVKWSRQANGGLVKCLPGDLLTCGQVGTQSIGAFRQDYTNRMEIRGRTPTR